MDQSWVRESEHANRKGFFWQELRGKAAGLERAVLRPLQQQLV